MGVKNSQILRRFMKSSNSSAFKNSNVINLNYLLMLYKGKNYVKMLSRKTYMYKKHYYKLFSLTKKTLQSYIKKFETIKN